MQISTADAVNKNDSPNTEEEIIPQEENIAIEFCGGEGVDKTSG